MSEDVAEILAQVGRTYAELNSYSDRGYVLSRKHPEEPFEKDKTFTTFFKKPNHFRFEWFECGQHAKLKGKDGIPNIVWCDGKNSYCKYTFQNSVERIKSLSSAIAGATGISGGTAHRIPSLLIDEMCGKKITDCQSLVLIAEDVTSDGKCYVLRLDKEGELYYIGKTDKIIQKIERDLVIDTKSMENELRSHRFKSLSAFGVWLIYKFATRSAPHGVLRHIQTSVYEEVNLNPDLPDDIFSEAGPAQILT